MFDGVRLSISTTNNIIVFFDKSPEVYNEIFCAVKQFSMDSHAHGSIAAIGCGNVAHSNTLSLKKHSGFVQACIANLLIACVRCCYIVKTFHLSRVVNFCFLCILWLCSAYLTLYCVSSHEMFRRLPDPEFRVRCHELSNTPYLKYDLMQWNLVYTMCRVSPLQLIELHFSIQRSLVCVFMW